MCNHSLNITCIKALVLFSNHSSHRTMQDFYIMVCKPLKGMRHTSNHVANNRSFDFFNIILSKWVQCTTLNSFARLVIVVVQKK